MATIQEIDRANYQIIVKGASYFSVTDHRSYYDFQWRKTNILFYISGKLVIKQYNQLISMKFYPILQQAVLLRRYKRFLADIRLDNGDETTIHCPNTGAMTRCQVPESPCWYSVSDNPKRKYPFTWEIATTPDGYLAGVNTGRANALVEEAIHEGVMTELQGYANVRREVKYGHENSRIDFLLTSQHRRACYVEVKSVTLGMEAGLGLFPDAVSQRGSRHLRELMAVVEQGQRAVLVFCVQHTAIDRVAPADNIDPIYGQTLRQAVAAGVEVIAYKADISAQQIVLRHKLPVLLEGDSITSS